MNVVYMTCPTSDWKMPPKVQFVDSFLKTHWNITLTELEAGVGREFVYVYMRHILTRNLATIARVHVRSTTSTFAIVIHHQKMHSNDLRGLFSFPLFDKPEWMLDIPYTSGYLELVLRKTEKPVAKSTTKAGTSGKNLEYKDFVVRVLKQQKANHPKRIINMSQKMIDAGAETVRQLHKIDEFPLEEIQSVVLWAIMDDFWTNNVFSLAPLRKRSPNGNTKFENMRNSFMEKAEPEKGQGEFSKVTKATYSV